jgi:hypothetical protein
MNAVEALPFMSTRMVAVPHASMKCGSSRLVWADGGSPTVLDAASTTMLDLFSDELAPADLGGDLEAVFALDREAATKIAYHTCYALRTSGLIQPAAGDPRPPQAYFYPPPASTCLNARVRFGEADKFVVVLPNVNVRVVSESPDLRAYLETAGLDLRNTLATNGLLLGRPSEGRSIGKPMWVLYESGSVVLRRSTVVEETFEAAAYHLRTVEHASGALARQLPLLSRVLIMPSGEAWLTDPYVAYTTPGLDRRLARAGITILPSTVASFDPQTTEVVLPEHSLGSHLPTGRFRVERMLYRTIPGQTIDGVEHLRLARLVLRCPATRLDGVLQQIDATVDKMSNRLELIETADLESELAGLASRR